MLQLEKTKKKPHAAKKTQHSKKKKKLTELGRRKDKYNENCPLRTDLSVFQGV